MAVPEHFDAVIVGSGFGGSVSAYELAAAGQRVCLLERGKRYPPGSFPRSPHRVARNFWDPSEGLYGMFDTWSFQRSEAIVASGLGGGSLIYANVLLRKPEEWFVERGEDGREVPWPVSRADLDPHYDEVERILGATPFPLRHPPYDATSKTLAFRAAAEELHAKGQDVRWTLPNLAVTFAASPGADPVPGEPVTDAGLGLGGANLHGRTRQTCRLCGECDVGCNYGSKNTLDYNYLTLAERARPHPCDIRDLCEVTEIRPRGDKGGYSVTYVRHDPERWEGRKRPNGEGREAVTLTADRVVLAAGTLGSTYLLLKNRPHLPALSRRLGSRYSGNGDLLTFAMRCNEKAAGKVGPRIIDPGRGPVITSAMRVDLGPHGGFFLEDAGYPEFVSWMVETLDTPRRPTRFVKGLLRRFGRMIGSDPRTEVGAQLSALLGPCHTSSGSLPLLGMGRDTASGTMTLKKKWLQVDWDRQGSTAYFDALTAFSRQVAETLGGEFLENPDTEHLQRVVSVHPLGGCPMALDDSQGVVDPWGEVFGHPGLYVADGAVMPGPVGANPSLTIAAMARRFASRMTGG